MQGRGLEGRSWTCAHLLVAPSPVEHHCSEDDWRPRPPLPLSPLVRCWWPYKILSPCRVAFQVLECYLSDSKSNLELSQALVTTTTSFVCSNVAIKMLSTSSIHSYKLIIDGLICQYFFQKTFTCLCAIDSPYLFSRYFEGHMTTTVEVCRNGDVNDPYNYLLIH